MQEYPPRRIHLRDAQAVKIQRVFRGWRVRQRVVWQVREEMELLVDDIQQELNGEWALLGPSASSFKLEWGDGKLCLPRMQGSLFGVDMSFPLEPEGQEDADGAADHESVVTVDATDGPSSPTPAAPSLDKFDNCQSVDACNVGGRNTPHSDSQGSEDGSSESETKIRESDIEIRNTAHQAETSETSEECQLGHQVESMDEPTCSKNEQHLASVQGVLATHSRDEILLELQWARQALHDRRKYLQSRRRVEQRPDPCACA
ncbi:hypothetical protein PHYBOEH_011981 [Phytophthora boehmeriae]|uniref:Uncharacterized protein n=1 Tax=Phytophthora boehmeriae TaxID=109152 RepID=A0A8T1WYG2_9STRA|nr:hypothetical protein PHYBOEH_011981 [Phytophthora boehmeriae]